MHKLFIICFTFICFDTSFAYPQEVDEWLGKFHLLKGHPEGRKFLQLLKKLHKEERYQEKLRGEVSAGFKSEDAPRNSADLTSSDKSSYDINAGFKLSRGNYPDLMTLSANIGVKSDNQGAFSENVSNIKLSYDHYFNYYLEGFVFLDRLSDDFLSIDQRYEVGGGLVLDFHPLDSKEPDLISITRKGFDTLKEIKWTKEIFGEIEEEQFKENPTWLNKYFEKKGISSPSKDDSIKVSKVLEAIKKRRDAAELAIRKRHSRLRVAFLLGFFNELEKASLMDSSSQIFRWELRPTIEARITNEISLRFDYYFKWAFGNSAKKLLDTFTPADDLYDLTKTFSEKTDLRKDIQLTLEVKPEGVFGGEGKVKVALTYRRLTDNIPPFTKDLVARKKHDTVQFKVSFTF